MLSTKNNETFLFANPVYGAKSPDSGMYTRNELRRFWSSILINAASRTALKNLLQSLVVYTTDQEGTDDSRYFTPRTEFFVDKMISPGYFKDERKKNTSTRQ